MDCLPGYTSVRIHSRLQQALNGLGETTMAAERPWITFLILAYNQERYIRDAIQGAFDQAYSPLEILLSDDCSTDHTVEIMKEMAAGYQGPHQVRLNRNERNLGLGGHVDRAMELARGELVVAAAGDDISLPERVERIWRSYVDSGGRAMSIYSGMTIIDENGRRQETVRRPPDLTRIDIQSRLANVGVCGCSQAWHRSVFEVFGPMLPGTVYEDKVIPLRSAMLGEICYIDEPLVLYRKHSQSITGRPGSSCADPDVGAQMVQRQTRRLLTLKNYERDLLHSHPSIRTRAEVRRHLATSARMQAGQLELKIAFDKGDLRDRIGVIQQGLSARIGWSQLAKWCFQLIYPYRLTRARKKLLFNTGDH